MFGWVVGGWWGGGGADVLCVSMCLGGRVVVGVGVGMVWWVGGGGG